MANRFLQASLASHFGNELDFGTCKIDSCGSNIEAFAHIRNDDIGKLAVGMKVARSTRRIVNQNVTFALGFKILVLLLSIPGIATMWMAVFADTGVAMLCILNSIRALYGRMGNV